MESVKTTTGKTFVLESTNAISIVTNNNANLNITFIELH